MSFARFRKLLLFALVCGAIYWIYKTRPTVSGFVDGLTRPLFGSNAAVKESEHKRVVAENVPAVGGDDAVGVAMLKAGMTATEVRDVIGPPDEIEQFRDENEIQKVRWTYRRLGRVLILRENRVESVAVR